jgi:hypothetical protein
MRGFRKLCSISQAIRPRQRGHYVFRKNTVREWSGAWHVAAGDPPFPFMYSRTPSDELAVKAWFSNYSVGLALVGIRLGLTPTQQSELEHRLLAVCHELDQVAASKGRFSSGADPIRSRWLADHISIQGDTWTGV